MSSKIHVKCEMRDRKILADTLTKLGYKFNEHDKIIRVKAGYQHIDISETDISCDSADRSIVSQIKVEYQKNLQLSQLALTGEQYEVVETEDKVSIYVF